MQARRASNVEAVIIFVATILAIPLWADSWEVLGPYGGDARSFAQSPRSAARILLGTSTGSIFLSTDAGHSWSQWARLGDGDHYVVDHIIAHPTNPDIIFASAWSVEDRGSGDIFASHDGGKTWATLPDMHGKPVRSLAMSPSNTNILVAGALDGVYLTTDAGQHWVRISPENHQAIKNIESVAIDPQDPDLIYAGTWHLAWKTSNRGATWHHINKGMVDDSDVFSIIVDSENPQVVFASACSGIYKSEDRGEVFRKVQGIPFAARRTRVLKQDPRSPNTVYAGTTEGLWKTSDSGKIWKQLTGPEIVINDVFVDPLNSSHILLATDRAGVLASDNGGLSFSPSNQGYTHRHVTAIVPDQEDSHSIHVGVAGDREWGGVFCLNEEQQSWRQNSAGLAGRDVLTLQQANNGALVAGTTRGLFIRDRGSDIWRPINKVSDPNPVLSHVKADQHFVRNTQNLPFSLAEVQVNYLELTPELWLAATSEGLFSSKNEGRSWEGGPVLGQKDFTFVRSSQTLQVLATRVELFSSVDEGKSWQPATVPWKLTTIRGVTLSPQAHSIFIVSREGAFRSVDAGKNWQSMRQGLPDKQLSSISYEPSRNLLLATSSESGVVFESEDNGDTWRAGPDSGYPLLMVKLVRERLFGATLFDGLVRER